MTRTSLHPCLALVTMLALVAAGPSDAAVHTWTGVTSEFWSEPTNWLGGVPSFDPGTTLVFPADAVRKVSHNDLAIVAAVIRVQATDYVIEGNPLAFGLFELAAPGSLTVNADIIVAEDTKIHILQAASLRLGGSLAGGGRLEIASDSGLPKVYLEGTAPNTLTGLLVTRGVELHLAKPQGVNAVAGPWDPSPKVVWDAGEQVADEVDLIASGEMVLYGEETVRSVAMHWGAKIGGTSGSALHVTSGRVEAYSGELNVPVTSDGDIELVKAGEIGAVTIQRLTSNSGGRLVVSGEYYYGYDSRVHLGVVDSGPIEIKGAVVRFSRGLNSSLEITGGSVGFDSGNLRSVSANGSEVEFRETTIDGDLTFRNSTLTATAPITVTGDVVLSNTRLFDYTELPRPPSQRIITKVSSGPVDGFFAALTEGTVWDQSADWAKRISYVAGDGNDVDVQNLAIVMPTMSAVASVPFIDVGESWTCNVGVTGPVGTPTGLVRKGPTVKALVDGRAFFVLEWPINTCSAMYLGDESYRSASVQKWVSGTDGAPRIDSVTPTQLEAGRHHQIIEVDGANLIGEDHFAHAIFLDWIPLKYTRPSPHRLRAMVASGHVSTAGTANVSFKGHNETATKQIEIVSTNSEPAMSVSGGLATVSGITPGARIMWFGELMYSPEGSTFLARRRVHEIVTDDNSDGAVTLLHGLNVVFGTLAAIDLESGVFRIETIGRDEDVYLGPLRAEPAGLTADGRLTRLAGLDLTSRTLVVRPGGGAWERRGTYLRDYVRVDALSGPAPESFEEDDVIIDISTDRGTGIATFGQLLRDFPSSELDVSIHDSTKEEGDSGTSNMRFLVSLSAPAPSRISVQYSAGFWGDLVYTISATAGRDYEKTFGEIVFEAGEQFAWLDVPVIGDEFGEQDQLVEVHISEPNGATIRFGSAYGVILDDDPVTASVQDVTVEENAGSAIVEVTLDHPHEAPVRVFVEVIPGTAHLDEDFLAVPSLVWFMPGQVRKLFRVPIIDDKVAESVEHATLVLTSDDVGIGRGYATLTIIDDDASSQTTLTPSSTEVNAGEDLRFDVKVEGVGAATPMGTVTIRSSGVLVAAAILRNGLAEIATSSIGPGVHLLTAHYPGGAGYAASVSEPVNVTVMRRRAAITHTVPSVVPFATTRTMAVTITDQDDVAWPAPGEVVLLETGTEIVRAVLVNGVADLPLEMLVPGVHSLQIEYGGDDSIEGAAATVSLTVIPRGSLNSDNLVTATDLVILANYLVGNISQGLGAFSSPLEAADLNRDELVNSVDLVILANYLVGNIRELPTGGSGTE